MENETSPTVSKWFVWTSKEHHFTETYEEAWKLSEKLYAETGSLAFIEPIYSL